MLCSCHSPIRTLSVLGSYDEPGRPAVFWAPRAEVWPAPLTRGILRRVLKGTVALLSHFAHPTRQPFASGLYSFVYHYARLLRRSGIDVVVYASAGSDIPDVDVRTIDIPDSPPEYLVLSALTHALSHAQRDPHVQLVHCHSPYGAQLMHSERIEKPFLQTVHQPPVPSMQPMFSAISRFVGASPHIDANCLCDAHARAWHAVTDRRLPVVRHGVTHYVPDQPACAPENYFAFVGRPDPRKGYPQAQRISAELNTPLHSFGTKNNGGRLVGDFVPQSEMFKQLARAGLLLAPIDWDEPFGLAIAEASCLGVPVVMHDRGSAREVIRPGLNGEITSSSDPAEFSRRVNDALTIDRESCRQASRGIFDHAAMLRGYVKIYERLQTFSS